MSDATKKMEDDRERWAKEYERKRGIYDDQSGYGRKDDESNGLTTIRGEKSHRDRAWRFNTLTDFLE